MTTLLTALPAAIKLAGQLQDPVAAGGQRLGHAADQQGEHLPQRFAVRGGILQWPGRRWLGRAVLSDDHFGDAAKRLIQPLHEFFTEPRFEARTWQVRE